MFYFKDMKSILGMGETQCGFHGRANEESCGQFW